ncbi:hypothetical protein LYSHEL_08630 [Lysobacter helvus]|uniref:VCBS repeat protein n=3 Tax=Lysobacterales TaxID=135614 RepID=A0ABN6FR15_9GAMM|nr:hypothetical protein LYSCAS_08630 [Lysobacter caseinilyticus]BCT94992.1 hypothetical protein LYSHEL_08630 [Lysobacter helvus]
MGSIARGQLPAAHARGIASLPDRGTLVAYPKATPIHDTAYTWRPVSISEDHAIAAIAKGELELTAPDGSPIRLRYSRHVEHADGNWTWIGSPAGATPGNEAIITFGPTAVFGTIPTRSGDTLRLTTIRGRTWMLETDGAMEARLGMTGADPSGRSDVRLPPRMAGARADAADMAMIRQARTASAVSGPLATANATTANASASTTVDLLVGYTPQFASRFGGTAGANTRITFLVDVANQAYGASQVDAALRLAGTLQVDYTEANSNSDALYDVTGVACTEQSNGSLNCDDKPVPAALAPLVAMREAVGADVVSLVRNYSSTAQQGCGIAWLAGAGQAGITATNDAPYGYSVVSDSNGDSGGAFPSNGTVCRDEALAHELGHNMGLQHDRETASDTDGVLQPEEYGVLPYSFGYRGGSASVYTVMAYGTTGLHKVRVFSNPNILCTWSGGPAAAPCGLADQADNARALRQTIPVVAAFRQAHTSHRNDYDGDGMADLLWHNVATGQNTIWGMIGLDRIWAAQVYREANTAWDVVASGDFNGDAHADVLWRNQVTGEDYVQLMNGTQVLAGSGMTARVSEPEWKLVARGDFDGDGKTDLYWRNTSNGLTAVWFMDGATLRNMSYVHRETDQAWTVVDTGDFNGDGYDDVLWRNTNTGENFVQFMQVTTVLPGSRATTTVNDFNWKIVAVNDFDGDGKDDIYWRNSVTGVNVLWKMDGATPTMQTSYTERDANWTIVNSGDYNGDNRADLVWRNVATGQVYMQLMSGATVLAGRELERVADLNWKIAGR